MNDSKKLNSPEILKTYGITDYKDSDRTLCATHFKPTAYIFDRNAVIHWFMGLSCPTTDRGVNVTVSWNNALNSLFRYMKFKGWMKSKQACVCYVPFRRHPIDDQIEEINLWALSTMPVTTNYGLSAVVPIWDRAGRDRTKYDLIIHDDHGRDVVELGALVAPNRYETQCHFDEMFDAIHYIRDNMYVDGNGFIPRDQMEGDYFWHLKNKNPTKIKQETIRQPTFRERLEQITTFPNTAIRVRVGDQEPENEEEPDEDEEEPDEDEEEPDEDEEDDERVDDDFWDEPQDMTI